MGGRWRRRVFCSSNRLYCCTLTLNSWKVFCCAISPNLNLSFYWVLCRSHTEEGFALFHVRSLFFFWISSLWHEGQVRGLCNQSVSQDATLSGGNCSSVSIQSCGAGRCFHLTEILSFHNAQILNINIRCVSVAGFQNIHETWDYQVFMS